MLSNSEYPKNSTQNFQQLYAHAQQLKKLGDAKGAISDLMSCLESNAEEVHCLQEIALLYRSLKQYQLAAEYYRRAIDAGVNSNSFFNEYVIMLIENGDLTNAEILAQERLKKHSKDYHLHNLYGVLLKRQLRYQEAIKELNIAKKLEPKNPMAWINLGNIYLELNDGKNAEKTYQKAIKLNPNESDLIRTLGKAQQIQGHLKEAEASYRKALKKNSQNLRPVANLIGLLVELGRSEQANEELNKLIQDHPGNLYLLGVKGEFLKISGKIEDAIKTFVEIVKANPKEVDAWINLGTYLAPYDIEKAIYCLNQAANFDNRSLRTLSRLCFHLNRNRRGDEAKNIQQAYNIGQELIKKYPTQLLEVSDYLWSLYIRCVDFDALDKLGNRDDVFNTWLRKERIASFQLALSRVVTVEDRYKMVEYHRSWGKVVEDRLKNKVIHHKPRVAREKIRIGFMSSDLRNHPVTYFTLPLLENYDKNRFEVYCYSFNSHPEDNVQKHITNIVDHFRWWPKINDEQAAHGIAEDELDILFELGGTTDMNKLQVMAYHPARLQASWLGYPHSSGLSIDYILVDPYLNPPDKLLLIEKPFELPDTWVTLGRSGFYDIPINTKILPEDHNGYITFGTMNNPYKYTTEMLATWATVMQQVPESRFLFVRPESGVPAFRNNIAKEFAKHGITPERILHVPIRGKHMPYYNAMDITLDTFPHVGGTTTCEALWMGIPTVTLVGPAFFERLSYSNLTNAGLADLCAFNLEEYIKIAVSLAQDKARREFLKHNLRQQIRELPLGQVELFAENFYKKIADVIG